MGKPTNKRRRLPKGNPGASKRQPKRPKPCPWTAFGVHLGAGRPPEGSRAAGSLQETTQATQKWASRRRLAHGCRGCFVQQHGVREGGIFRIVHGGAQQHLGLSCRCARSGGCVPEPSRLCRDGGGGGVGHKKEPEAISGFEEAMSAVHVHFGDIGASEAVKRLRWCGLADLAHRLRNASTRRDRQAHPDPCLALEIRHFCVKASASTTSAAESGNRAVVYGGP